MEQWGYLLALGRQAQILAVEIQERLADMAERSVRLNGLEEQMEVICDDLKICLLTFREVR